MKFDKAGKVLGIVGTGYSAYEAYNAEGLKRFEYGLDAVMGAAGFIPEVGPFISLYWGVGGKQRYWMWVNDVAIPQYHMGILGLPSTMPFK
jgi:hypothetical protein